jgi:ribonucleoside-triphosphate reductase
VAEAHYVGDLHLHDLGFIIRPYCGGHSLEYIKKFGLNLPNITSVSKPAKHAEVLIGHMVKMASALQAHYAGAVGWEAVNVFFAPYLVGRTFEQLRQLAQMLIFEFNQLAGARGSQVVFTDFNLYYNVPRHFADTPAIGPGGKYTGKTYGDYAQESQDFLRAMFEVYLEGDATGKTFVFPKPLLHINEDFFRTPGHEEFMALACEVASKQGITYFVFDRGDEVTVSQCCRLKLKLSAEQLDETKTPEVMRFSALQNVTVNLPRVAYKAQGNDQALFMELNRTLELVAKAHVQKREFIATLIDLGKEGPLGLLTQDLDGKPYLKMDKLTYLAGLIGLNELVQVHTGQQLHESDEALRFGLKVIAAMSLKCRELSERYGMHLVLEESPAESAGYRLAKLDMKYWPAQAAGVVKGDLTSSNYYYTNSIHLAVDAPIDYIERVEKQSRFHPLIEAGAIVHVWLGESEPDPKAIESFVVKTFRNTQCSQIAFSPEFTVCESCGRTSRGLKAQCPLCGSMSVYGVTRIVGYFSKVQTWNRSKVGELYDRVRTDLGQPTAIQ